MCGINGILLKRGIPTAGLRRAIDAMNAAVAHRGPDDERAWVDEAGRAAFGHRRLSIIDLTGAAAQPMQSDDDGVIMVFNGEIYNFLELRAELQQHGYSFRSTGDGEVALKAFHCWGTAAFRRFNGMFAIAFCDRRNGKAYLVRDRLGIKPLHYLADEQGLYFSSEIKGINAARFADVTPSFEYLHEFLYFGNTLGEATLFKGVKRVLPGHYFEIDLQSLTIADHCYWSASTMPETSVGEQDALAAVRALIEQAIKRQLVSDVPLGVFLSGGVDSTAVVALATKHYSGRLRTYTVGFDDVGDRDEVAKARGVAERFGTEHHEIHVAQKDAMAFMAPLIAAHDMPFSDAANLPLYQLCHALGGETKAILQGDGGDELFAGYNRYQLLSLKGLQPLAPVVGLLNNMIGPWSAAAHARRRLLAALAEPQPAGRMARLLTVENPDDNPASVLEPALRAEVTRADPFRRYREVAKSLADRDPVQMMLLADLQIILPDIFLEKVDRSTMAQSVEVRVPFLDHDLVDYVVSLPACLKVNWRQKKRLLRKALRGTVPNDILNGPKVGFGVPFSAWMRGTPADRLLDALTVSGGRAGAVLDRRNIELRVQQHRSGRRDHGFMLWKCLQLVLWLEHAASFTSSMSDHRLVPA